jgi:transcriptional regulator with XRE-family HTH domain
MISSTESLQPQQPAAACATARLVSDDAQSFGASLYAHRMAAGMTQADAALQARVSASYFSSIENGKRLPPPRQTALRIARALGLERDVAVQLVKTAQQERGTDRRDEDLPPEVQLLIRDLRVHAFAVPGRFVTALRTKLKEAVV